MKLSNKTILYIYVVVLFALTFLLTRNLIKGIKTMEFDYLKLGINVGLLIYIIIKVTKLGKIENDKSE